MNKKKQKNFDSAVARVWQRRSHTHSPGKKKFFVSFFQKRTASSPAAGFTLLEVMVVIAMMGLLLMLVVSRGPVHSTTLTLRAAASAVAETLRGERATAIASGQSVLFTVDPASRSFGSVGAMRTLPAGVAMSETTQPRGPILFQPDGSASSGIVRLAAGKLSATVTVDWLTGRVSVGQVHADAED